METYYENEKSIIFQKGICDLEEFFNFFPEPDEEMLILIIDSILRSINFIHNTVGIPHFDIKLKNFLFCLENSSFVLKLIDFGNIIPLDKNKYEEMKKNDFFKLNKLLSTISEKSSKKSFSDWKITIPNIQTIQDEASFKELYQEFKTLEIKEDIYKLLYQKYFQRNEVEISFKTMNSNVSDEDKITLSDNLCLMGVFTKSLILILQIELDFFKKNLKYYIRVIQNKMILLVTFYYPKFLELKCRSLDLEPQLNFSENFKKLLELIEITYKENFDFLNKKIRSSDKIFGKFHSLLKELQILRDYLKNVTISENKGILEQIKVVQEKNKNKIKTKNEFSRRHIEIYHNFWEFLEISISCPEDHKLLEESWLNNFKNLVKKYIVVYNVDM